MSMPGSAYLRAFEEPVFLNLFLVWLSVYLRLSGRTYWYSLEDSPVSLSSLLRLQIFPLTRPTLRGFVLEFDKRKLIKE